MIRDALREYLRILQLRALEKRDRDGYLKTPDTSEGLEWESEAVWPEV